MTMFPKIPTMRSPKYIAWVKTLPCCHTQQYGVDGHHVMIPNEGIMGSKSGDFTAVPLIREVHDQVTKAPHEWPQMKWLVQTLNRAFAEGVLKV